jgi:hypothetical protein
MAAWAPPKAISPTAGADGRGTPLGLFGFDVRSCAVTKLGAKRAQAEALGNIAAGFPGETTCRAGPHKKITAAGWIQTERTGASAETPPSAPDGWAIPSREGRQRHLATPTR